MDRAVWPLGFTALVPLDNQHGRIGAMATFEKSPCPGDVWATCAVLGARIAYREKFDHVSPLPGRPTQHMNGWGPYCSIIKGEPFADHHASKGHTPDFSSIDGDVWGWRASCCGVVDLCLNGAPRRFANVATFLRSGWRVRPSQKAVYRKPRSGEYGEGGRTRVDANGCVLSPRTIPRQGDLSNGVKYRVCLNQGLFNPPRSPYHGILCRRLRDRDEKAAIWQRATRLGRTMQSCMLARMNTFFASSRASSCDPLVRVPLSLGVRLGRCDRCGAQYDVDIHDERNAGPRARRARVTGIMDMANRGIASQERGRRSSVFADAMGAGRSIL